MKNIKLMLCGIALVLGVAGSSHAQLLGGTLKSSTSAAGSVSGQRGGLLGGLNSATQIGGSAGNSVQSSSEAGTQATVKGDRRKTEKPSAAKRDENANPASSRMIGLDSNANAGVAAGSSAQTDSSSNTKASSSGKAGQMQASSNTTGNAKISHQHHAQDIDRK